MTGDEAAFTHLPIT